MMTTLGQTLRTQLQRARRAAKFTPSDIDDQLDWAAGTTHQIEDGRHSISSTDLAKLAGVLGQTSAWFFQNAEPIGITRRTDFVTELYEQRSQRESIVTNDDDLANIA